jgi:hypothetical protein
MILKVYGVISRGIKSPHKIEYLVKFSGFTVLHFLSKIDIDSSIVQDVYRNASYQMCANFWQQWKHLLLRVGHFVGKNAIYCTIYLCYPDLFLFIYIFHFRNKKKQEQMTSMDWIRFCWYINYSDLFILYISKANISVLLLLKILFCSLRLTDVILSFEWKKVVWVQ